MGKFLDSGIPVYIRKRDSQGRDLGEVTMVLKEGRKDGVYLVDMSAKGRPIYRTFSPRSVTVFRKADAQDKSVIGRALVGSILASGVGAVIGGLSGLGKKDAWFLEIRDKCGPPMTLRLRNQQEGRSMERRIRRHMACC